MMRTLTFVMLVCLCMFGEAEAFTSDNHSASLIWQDQSAVHPDTIFDAASHEMSLLPPQNLAFKLKLDTLQKSVPLNYNEYVQNYLDIYLSRKEQIGKMLGLSKYYFPIFEKALKEAGLPDELKFMTVIESALNPHAVSKSGAVGPWQFMFATAKGYGLVMDNYVDERKDPVKASLAAAHYLVDAYKRIGDWLLTVAAFNCGTGAVTRAIEKSGGIPDFWRVRSFLPKETQNYVPAFIATVYAMNYHKAHGIQSRPADFNVFTDIIDVNRHISIASIARAANLDMKELLVLNPSYKKQIVNGSTQFPKSLVIPAVSNDVFSSLYDVLNGYEDHALLTASVKEKNDVVAKNRPEYTRVQPGQHLVASTVKGAEERDFKIPTGSKTSTLIPNQSQQVSLAGTVSDQGSRNAYMSYIVKVGDTLSGIADKFSGLTVSKIKALNGLTQSAISPGMKLIISRL